MRLLKNYLSSEMFVFDTCHLIEIHALKFLIAHPDFSATYPKIRRVKCDLNQERELDGMKLKSYHRVITALATYSD